MNNQKKYINFGYVQHVIRFIGKVVNIKKLGNNLKNIIDNLINSKYLIIKFFSLLIIMEIENKNENLNTSNEFFISNSENSESYYSLSTPWISFKTLLI